MRILLDCVVTAEPAKCSSTVQFLHFVKRTLATRQDVFFYWLIPEWVTQDQFLSTYPQDSRVKYIPVPQHKDRTKEYLTLSHQLDSAVAFNGPLWDFDVLLTMRTGLCPLFKLLMMSPRHNSMAWTKEVWLIEEMPLMDFKKTVMTINADVQDLFTLSGYLAADKAYICSYHEKPAIVRRAREFLTPSHVKEIAAKLQPICTTQFSNFRLKSPAEMFVPGQQKPFCISYVGRMEKANRIEEINDLMIKQFVMKGDAVRLLVCTQSKIEKVFDKSVVDVRMANRDEFWSLAQNDMHVLVKMSIEGGFTLSLLEPMMFGVPAVLIRAPWAEALVGADYPFLVKNETEAYAFVSEFYRDYAGMYAKYAEWSEKVFQPLFKARFATDLLYDHLDREIERFKTGVIERFRTDYPGKKTNSMVLDVLAEVGDAQEFVFQEIVERLVDAKKMDRKMVEKLMPTDRDMRGLVWATGWNEFRLSCMAHYGWKDASTNTGHLKRGGSPQPA